MDSSYGVIVGLALGVLSSIIVWFFTARVLVPKINFSEGLYRHTVKGEDNAISSYRFEIENTGKRDIFDLDVYFCISITGLLQEDINEYIITPIFPDMSKIAVLKSEEKLAISIHIEQLKKYFPTSVKDKFRQKRLTLDDIYSLGSETYSEIIVFGHDDFSGTKKHFRSPKFKLPLRLTEETN